MTATLMHQNTKSTQLTKSDSAGEATDLTWFFFVHCNSQGRFMCTLLPQASSPGLQGKKR